MSLFGKQYISIADGKYLIRSTEHEAHLKTIIEEELPNGYEPISFTYSENVIPGSDYFYVLLKKVEKKQTKEQKTMDIIKNP